MRSQTPGTGLLGGTFDPVHNGHISIADSFLNSGHLNELWILLTPDPPHKKQQAVAGFEFRLEMLTAAFRACEDIKISDLENRLPRPSYTVQTVSHLSRKYPDRNFYLCMGEDSLADFKQWQQWREILSYSKLLVAERPNTSHPDLDSVIAERAFFVHHEPVEISSSEIRRRVSGGQEISEFVPGPVEQLIRKHKLYR